MTDRKISGANLVQLISSTIATGHILAGVIASTADGITLLNDDQRNELHTRIIESGVDFKEAESANIDVGDGEAIFGFITIDANGHFTILDSKGASSLTDNSTHSLSVNFMHHLGKYVFHVISSEDLTVVSAKESSSNLQLQFDKPITGNIHIMFSGMVGGIT